MHSGLTFSDLAWAFGIPALQILVSLLPGIKSLRVFLFAEGAYSIIQAALVFALGKSSQPYLYIWIAGAIVHHALFAYTVSNLFSIVRLRGLPSRQSQSPVLVMLAASIALGIYFAFVSNGMIENYNIRIIIPLDYAMGLTEGCMLVMLPFYCIAISSSMPRPVFLALAGLSIYEISYLGLMGSFITYRRMNFPHGADFVYLLSLTLWLLPFIPKARQWPRNALSIAS